MQSIVFEVDIDPVGTPNRQVTVRLSPETDSAMVQKAPLVAVTLHLREGAKAFRLAETTFASLLPVPMSAFEGCRRGWTMAAQQKPGKDSYLCVIDLPEQVDPEVAQHPPVHDPRREQAQPRIGDYAEHQP
jgi:hypothetical protein